VNDDEIVKLAREAGGCDFELEPGCVTQVIFTLDKLRAFGEAYAKAGGMVLVPRKLTDKMAWALCEMADECSHCPASVNTAYGKGVQACRLRSETIYRAMIAAGEAE
jgi:hypothetical protein